MDTIRKQDKKDQIGIIALCAVSGTYFGYALVEVAKYARRRNHETWQPPQPSVTDVAGNEGPYSASHDYD